MRNLLLMLVTLLANEAQAGEVAVCVENVRVVPIEVFQPAQVLAEQMFRGTGAKIEWRRCKPSRPQPKCEQPIVIEMVAGEPSPRIARELKRRAPGALAFAFPYDRFRIVILFNRVREATYRDLTPNVLAHVMVHEITHVLQKTSYHADTGIMKARWTHDDYMEMKKKPLSFTETDIQLIRSGMAEPAGGCPPSV